MRPSSGPETNDDWSEGETGAQAPPAARGGDAVSVGAPCPVAGRHTLAEFERRYVVFPGTSSKPAGTAPPPSVRHTDHGI
jgi:hypothetical protein